MKTGKAESRDREIELLGIMDTPEDRSFTMFSELARDLFEVPIAGISFITSRRHWFKTVTGNVPSSLPREHSFCAHVAESETGTLFVEDAAKHPLFMNNPMVTKEDGVRFYAGAAIRSESGVAIGALCIVDTVPREHDESTMNLLKKMAEGVSTSIALHGSRNIIADMRSRDPLTGVRRAEEIRTKVSTMAIRGENFTLIAVDIDKLSVVNGLFGHAGGDGVLKETARRLTVAAGNIHDIGRDEEDEFLILFSGMSNRNEAAAAAERIQRALRRKFIIAGHRMNVTVSLGIAVSSDMRGADINAAADSALSASKRAGGNRISVAGTDSVPGRQAMSVMLRKALTKPGEEPFIFYYQPCFSVPDNVLLGFEALIRWPTETGNVSPGDFIPLAEADGSIVRIDRWGLRTACAAAMKWPGKLSIAVNVSSAGFLAGDLPADVLDALNETGLEPSRLKLELTETVLLPDMEQISETMEKLHEIGVKLVLDDFGCGHASLGYVRDYPFDSIKIDRSFIRDIAEDRKSRSLLHAIIELGTTLGVETVAEGVETPEQMSILKEERVSSVQGYLCGRPLPEPEALSLAVSRFSEQSPSDR